MTTGPSASPTVASRPRRIGALVVDWAVALLTTSLITRTPLLDGSVNPFVPVAVFWLETTLLTGLLGFTIGKRLTGIQVVGPDGRPIGVAKAALRTFLVCLLVPAIVRNPEGRGLHDVVVTSVVTPRAA